MSRFLAIVAAVFALAGSALAQSPGGPASIGPAPATHAGTKLGFPSSLGGATLEDSQSSGTAAVSYRYAINKMQIYVFLFENGRRVPPGSDTPALMAQFTAEVNQAEEQIKSAGYTQYERPAVPSSCTYGSVTFRCIVYDARAPGGRLFSKLLMTGYRDNFLKIRIDWSQGAGQTQADADKALESFVPALLH